MRAAANNNTPLMPRPDSEVAEALSKASNLEEKQEPRVALSPERKTVTA
jgi:hypothetical protein